MGEIHYNALNQREKYIRYTYDESDSIIGIGIWYAGISQSWEEYYFETNLQGDIIAVYTADNGSNGIPELVASYTYDAWGNVLSATGELAEINPFRYRGYYYDTESNFYYLQSRYYNPEIGRFLNADVFASTGQGFLGHNLFAYCANNPINFADTKGMIVESIREWAIKVVEIILEGLRQALISLAEKDQTALALAQTIYGEAGGSLKYDDWEEGQRAVAYTIINRHKETGKDWYTIVSEPNQYEGYAGGKYKYQTGNLEPISWDYSLLLAGCMVWGLYDMIPMPEGFTDKHKYLRTDEGQSYVEWGGIRRIAGNVFFYYVSEMEG